MTVTETASAPNRSKRTRVDPTAALPRRSEQPATKKPASPKTIAENWIHGHCATLHPQISSIVRQYGLQYISLKAQEHNKLYQVDRMVKDTEFIPRSARIQFQYSLSMEARAKPEYEQLLAQTNREINEFQHKLKSGIIQATKLELTVHQDKVKTLTVRAIHDVTKAFLIVDRPGTDPTTLPITSALKEVLSSCHDDLKQHTCFSDSAELYSKFNSHHSMTITQSTIQQVDHSDSIALQMYQETLVDSTPSIHQSISTTLLSVLHHSWNEFLKQYQKNATALELKKFETEIFVGTTTAAACDMIEAEQPLDQMTVNKLITDATDQKTKRLENMVSKLAVQVNSLAKNSAQRGAANPSFNQNSSKNNGKAAASGNAGRKNNTTSSKHSQKPAARTTKGKSRQGSRKQRNPSSTRSG